MAVERVLVPVRVENSFIGVDGVGETLERRLWDQGITRWDAFEPGCDGIGETRATRIESFIDAGRSALADGDVAFFDRAFPSRECWRLYRDFRERTCFFDIETTGLSPERAVVTTVTLHQDGDTRTLVRGDDLTDDELAAAFEGADLLVTFNGARFDVPFLETKFDVDLDRPHVDLMPTCGQLGLSGGLSAVEAALDIGRELPDVDGREAVRLWHEHERGVDGALDRLVRYNREDTENMVPVLEQTVEALAAERFPDEATPATGD